MACLTPPGCLPAKAELSFSLKAYEKLQLLPAAETLFPLPLCFILVSFFPLPLHFTNSYQECLTLCLSEHPSNCQCKWKVGCSIHIPAKVIIRGAPWDLAGNIWSLGKGIPRQTKAGRRRSCRTLIFSELPLKGPSVSWALPLICSCAQGLQSGPELLCPFLQQVAGSSLNNISPFLNETK